MRREEEERIGEARGAGGRSVPGSVDERVPLGDRARVLEIDEAVVEGERDLALGERLLGAQETSRVVSSDEHDEERHEQAPVPLEEVPDAGGHQRRSTTRTR